MLEPVEVATAIPAAPSAGVRRVIVVIAAALIAAIAVSIPFHLVWDRDQTLDEAYTETENLAAAVAQQTFQSLSAIDYVLHDLSHAVTGEDLDAAGARRVIHRRLAELRAIKPDVIEFGLTDRTGRLAVSSTAPEPYGVDFAAHEAHRVHAEQPKHGLFVSRPGRGGLGVDEGSRSLILSRRLGHPDDPFAGAVLAAVTVGRFQQSYDTLRIGENGSIGLIRADAVLLVRSPHDDRMVGVDFSHRLDFRPDEQSVTGHFRTAIAADGVVRIGTYRFVPDYGLIIQVSVSEQERLAEWRRRALIEAGSALVLIGLVVAALLVALRALKRADSEHMTHAARLDALARASIELGTIRNLNLLL